MPMPNHHRVDAVEDMERTHLQHVTDQDEAAKEVRVGHGSAPAIAILAWDVQAGLVNTAI